MENTQRKLYIDQAKGIGMLMIILQHISNSENMLLAFGNSFKIIIFFIISGYLFSIKDLKNINPKDYIKKKFKSLIIPYIIFSIIFIFINIILLFINQVSLNSIIANIYDFITLKGFLTLWFLPILFLVEIIYFFISKYLNNYKKIFDTVLIFIAFTLILLLGYLKINIWELLGTSMISKIISRPFGVIIKLIISLGFFIFSVNFSEKILKFSKYSFIAMIIISFISCQFNFGIDFNNVVFGENPIIFIICSLLASYGIIGFLKSLNYSKKGLLHFLGFNSLFIMCTHLLYITQIVKKVVPLLIKKLNFTISYSIEIFICLIIIIFIEYIMLHIWNLIKKKFFIKV